MTVKAGMTLKIRAIITGKPVPKVTWMQNGEEITANTQVHLLIACLYVITSKMEMRTN